MELHDFVAGATLLHRAESACVFTGEAEIGRASASVGSGNGGLTAVARRLGPALNGTVWEVQAPGAVGGALIDSAPSGGTPRIKYRPVTGDACWESAEAFLPHYERALRTRDAARVGAQIEVVPMGDGSDPAVAGVATFAGGMAPLNLYGGLAFGRESGEAGLFCFDANFPLLLCQVAFDLGASVAWSLRLAYLTSSRGVDWVVPITNATSASGLVTTPVVILPGQGISFVAATQGLVSVTVKRLGA